ncbi:MAG: hypothetical protein CMQ75_03285 [Gammaproteobacteria bacterium]|nr:hypothetical protein [Gammaproteobacteria bacterium]|tara:strand:+ start:9451 stop:10704 length:1254 start_codon:yes stop_codon:yes gene_type:complete
MNKKAILICSNIFVKNLKLFEKGEKYFVAPELGCYIDLYIHVDNISHLKILDNYFHAKFYTYKNNLLPNNLSVQEQLIGLVREKSKKYNIEYNEVIYIDKHLNKNILNLKLDSTEVNLNKKLKVAVILAGQPRLVDHSLPTLFKWLEGTEYKIFGHTWQTIGGEGNDNKSLDGSAYRHISNNENIILNDLMKDHCLIYGNGLIDPIFPKDDDLYNWQGERTFQNVTDREWEQNFHARGWPGWGFSSWTGYDKAWKACEQSNEEFDLVIRSRWDMIYSNHKIHTLIAWLNSLNTLKNNQIYFHSFENAWLDDPRNYSFFNITNSIKWLKDHIWIGSFKAQYNFMKNYLDWTNIICMENDSIKCNARQFPFAESFLYMIMVKNGFTMLENPINAILAKPGLSDYTNYKKVVEHAIKWYQ